MAVASINKRGKYWRAQIRKKGFPPKSSTFDTKPEAEAWARFTESEMDRRCFVDRSESERTSLADALDRYSREVSPLKRSSRQELRRIRLWKANPLAYRSLSSLRGADFAKFRDERRLEGKAPTTIRLDLALISHLFETARKEWGMESLMNPLKNIRKPAVPSGRERRLEAGEYDRIILGIEKCRTPWMRPAFELALSTALRRSMLVKLRWEWVDLEARVINIPPEFREIENKGVPIAIPLWPSTYEMLKTLERSDDGRIIPLTPNALELSWKHIKKHAGLLNLRWHDLRHEATTRLFELGMNPFEVASITGHKSMQMLKRYTHIRATNLLAKYGGLPAGQTGTVGTSAVNE